MLSQIDKLREESESWKDQCEAQKLKKKELKTQVKVGNTKDAGKVRELEETIKELAQNAKDIEDSK